LARDLAEDDARAAAERAEATPQVRLVRALRLLADALAAARNSGNARLELESAVLRLVLQGEDPSLDALAARLAVLEGGEAPARPAAAAPKAEPPVVERAAEAVPPKPPPVAGGELSVQKLRSLWNNIRTRAEAEKTSLRAGLSRATVASLDGDVLMLRVPDPPAADIIKRDVASVKKAIAEITGRNVDVRVTVGSGGTPPPDGTSNHDGEGADDLMRYALEKLT
jgi:hypothetical protein